MVVKPVMLWGMGTALGELPPYWLARKASEAGKVAEEFDEIASSLKETNEISR